MQRQPHDRLSATTSANRGSSARRGTAKWDGQVIYYGRPRGPCGDAEGSPARIFPALDFLAALCTHVPDSGRQLVRYQGGEETLVLEKGEHTYWGLARDGLVFVDRYSVPPRIQFFDFETGRLILVAELPKGTHLTANPSIAVSPDGRWILYAAFMQRESDIFVAENFR